MPEVSDEAFESSLVELERLADTLGLEIVARITQRRASLAPGAVLGEGKLRELAAFTGGPGFVQGYVKPGTKKDADDEAHDDIVTGENPDAPRATVVLVDHDLSPSQMRNLEKATDAEVLDRTSVILSIFQRHARTREAKMQVEIARLAYAAPRLREAGAGQDRQRGGVGGKGAGESSLELDRRKIRDRIAELRAELEHVKRESDTRRSRRSESYTVALVGYTNAGKSSLMRALTGDEVYVADQLFATLDTTVRALKPEVKPRILVSDTVGFIKKLPHDLVASFRSTLEEAKDASLLLHLVDGSDPAFRDQYRVTREVLEEIGAGDGPSLLVLNKADRLSEEERRALRAEFPGAVLMSARSADDVASLHARITQFFEEGMEEEEFLIPYDAQRHVAMLHERSRVLAEQYGDEGTRVRVKAPPAILGHLRREIRGGQGA
jgi:GTPase